MITVFLAAAGTRLSFGLSLSPSLAKTALYDAASEGLRDQAALLRRPVLTQGLKMPEEQANNSDKFIRLSKSSRADEDKRSKSKGN